MTLQNIRHSRNLASKSLALTLSKGARAEQGRAYQGSLLLKSKKSEKEKKEETERREGLRTLYEMTVLLFIVVVIKTE